MKPQFAFALVLAATPALAQQTGVSKPVEATVQDVPMPVAVPAPVAKPSAAIPATAPSSATEFGEYKPYHGPEVALHTRPVAAPVDPDSTFVTALPTRANELPAGTPLHMRLRTEVATETTQPGTPFRADLAEDVMSEGRVVMPVGSIVEGTITQVRGGRRIHGTALIHLQAQAVVLPDGSRIPLHAAVIDTDQYANTRVDVEGNILRKDHVGATLAAMSLTTGGAAAAGGVIGGGVGAIVGAGIGAGVSTAWWLKQDRQTHLPKDSLVVVALTEALDLHGMTRQPELSKVPAEPSATTPAVKADKPVSTEVDLAPQAFVPGN